MNRNRCERNGNGCHETEIHLNEMGMNAHMVVCYRAVTETCEFCSFHQRANLQLRISFRY